MKQRHRKHWLPTRTDKRLLALRLLGATVKHLAGMLTFSAKVIPLPLLTERAVVRICPPRRYLNA